MNLRSCMGFLSAPLVAILGTACMAGESSDVSARIAAARPGAVVRLPAGDLGTVKITGKHWDRPVTIEAGDSRMMLIISDSSGIRLRGGAFGTPPVAGTRNVGLRILRSRGIVVEGSRFSQATIGLAVGQSEDVVIRDVDFSALLSDGINIAMSRNVDIHDVRCHDFTPIKPNHPDCIQGFSRPKAPPTADIRIARVTMSGPTQGIFFGNHVRGGIDDGGFDRIDIRDSDIRASYLSGIALYDCRDCTVVNNRVRTFPGGKRSIIRIHGGTVRACGNKVENFARDTTSFACPGGVPPRSPVR